MVLYVNEDSCSLGESTRATVSPTKDNVITSTTLYLHSLYLTMMSRTLPMGMVGGWLSLPNALTLTLLNIIRIKFIHVKPLKLW